MLKNLGTFLALVSIVTIFMYANVAKADIVTDGLISYWSLDKGDIDGKTVKDVWGKKNDGTMKGTKSVKGKIGDALEFNGVDDVVNIPGTDSLNFSGKKQFSVAAWVYRQGPSGGICCGSIIAQRDVNAWALRYDNRDVGAEVEFIICPGWVGDGGDFGVPLPEKEWHYITGVLTGAKTLIYLDGELKDEIAFAAGAVSGAGTATTIGGASDGYFKGIIDEALIYDRALSEKEVKQNFESKVFSAVDARNKLATCWGEIKVSR
ncbi:LamG domain-containing protein [Candidatus Poribacteria bacterium]|nr:LamG domain-containing protein [Candidatus Poribacteria bacterium]